MAKKKEILKRSKHLVVQDNPFKTKKTSPQHPGSLKREDIADADNYYRIGGQDGEMSYSLDKLQKDKDKDSHITFKIIRPSAEGSTEEKVTFYPFVDSVSESFNVNFSQTEKIGSTEPIYQYGGTTKQINLSWKAMQDDYELPIEGSSKFDANGRKKVPSTLRYKIDLLKSMTYPTIDALGRTTAPPVLEMKFGPLKEEFASSQEGERSSDSIFGYITNLSIDYSSQEAGYKDPKNPRMITFNVAFQQINRAPAGIYDKRKIKKLGS